jgi:hypothetical protein
LKHRPSAPNATATIVDLEPSRAASPSPGGAGAERRRSVRKESRLETAEGTLHVKPFRMKGSKGLKAVLTFVPRPSAFDRENVASGADPFRWFFTLFWISVSSVPTCCIVRWSLGSKCDAELPITMCNRFFCFPSGHIGITSTRAAIPLVWNLQTYSPKMR